MSKPSNKVCPSCAATTVITNGMSLCEFHQSAEHRHVWEVCLKENKRAEKHGLIGDLTAEQFVVSARYFAIPKVNSLAVWACAYCGRACKPGLDHWNPLSLGGASTFTNVLPCCPDCNYFKSASKGDEFLDYVILTWKSPVAKASKTNIANYWQLVEQGIDAVYQAAMKRI